MAEEDKRIEGRYIAFRRKEAKKNREQELRIAEIFARAAQLTSHQTLVSVTFQLVTLPHQGVHILQTK